MFVTVLYGILNGATREFRYARAGHDLPLVMDAQREAIHLEKHLGQPLGLFPDPLLDEQSLTLPSGSLLFLYTDGVTETTNACRRILSDPGAAGRAARRPLDLGPGCVRYGLERAADLQRGQRPAG